MDKELLEDIVVTIISIGIVGTLISIFNSDSSSNVSNNSEKAYKARDDIEKSVSELLSFKDVIHIQNNNNIKVELFHGYIGNEQLDKIEKILNKAFEIYTQYNFTPCSANVNIRAFLLDDKNQFINLVKSIYDMDVNNLDGVTISNDYSSLSNADIYFYQMMNDKSYFYRTNGDSFVLAHEFFHGLYNSRFYNYENNLVNCPPIEEGLASIFAWQALNELDYYNQKFYVKEGCEIIRDNQLSLYDIASGINPVVNENSHRIGEAAVYFMLDKHPEIINSMSDYYLRKSEPESTNCDVSNEFCDRVHSISNSSEFPDWVSNQCDSVFML